MSVEGSAAPANEPGGTLRGTALRAGVLGNCQLVRDDARFGHGPAEAGSVPSCGSDAGVDSLDNQLMFLFGQGDERVQHQPACRGRGSMPSNM